MTDISHEKQKCKFQTSHQTTRSKQRVYNAERRNHTEPNCSHLPRTHPAQVRRAHMSTSLHRVRSYLYKRAIFKPSFSAVQAADLLATRCFPSRARTFKDSLFTCCNLQATTSWLGLSRNEMASRWLTLRLVFPEKGCDKVFA